MSFYGFTMRDKKRDAVNAPPHYLKGGIECIDAIKSALGDEQYKGFLRGQVLKYIWRAPHKGKELEDYLKAQFYLNKIIQEEECD
jgi:hypothetical protein